MSRQPQPERLTWLEFRDAFIQEQTELFCFYCHKELQSDVPLVVRKPKDRFYRRVKGIPKELIATVDHVRAVSKGGERYDKKNLVVACTDCNAKKGNKDLGEWQKEKYEKPDPQGTPSDNQPESVPETRKD